MMQRRSAVVALAAVVVLAGCTATSTSGFVDAGGSPATSPTATGAETAATPAVGQAVRGFRFAALDTELFMPTNSALLVVVIPELHPTRVTLLRLSGSRKAVRHFPFRLGASLSDISVGRHGLYLGTSVIRRFSRAPDQLLRIDPRTLRVVARATFPQAIATSAQGDQMWATIQDGRVVRLDPRTLAVLASQRVTSQRAEEMNVLRVSKPAVGLGSVWVLVGNETRLDLLRIDPNSLAILGRTRVPTRGRYAQAFSSVLGTTNHVYLVGTTAAAVSRHGVLTFFPPGSPRLSSAAISGTSLLTVTDPQPWLIQFNSDGRELARSRIDGAGGPLVLAGHDAWLQGRVGSGTGIVQVRLRSP